MDGWQTHHQHAHSQNEPTNRVNLDVHSRRLEPLLPGVPGKVPASPGRSVSVTYRGRKPIRDAGTGVKAPRASWSFSLHAIIFFFHLQRGVGVLSVFNRSNSKTHFAISPTRQRLRSSVVRTSCAERCPSQPPSSLSLSDQHGPADESNFVLNCL